MNNRELYNETTEISNLTEFSFTQLDKTNVTIEYCEAIIHQSKQAIGYALNIAKTYIYPDDKEAYTSWLRQINITDSVASFHIKYYRAKNLYTEDNMIPDTASKFNRLVGNTVQDKVNNYNKVKTLLMEDYPSEKDIIVVNRILARGLLNKDMELQVIHLLTKRSDVVKTHFCSHYKLAGITSIIASLERGDNDVDVMAVIQGGASTNKTDKVTNRKKWDKLSANEKYARVMYLERQLEKTK